MASTSVKLLSKVRDVLAERLFSDQQIQKIIPRLDVKMIEEPKYLAEIVDAWNSIMASAGTSDQRKEVSPGSIPPVAKPGKTSLLAGKVDMNTILADVEPDLLLLDPKKLEIRHDRVGGLGLAKNLNDQWTLLFNAPRGIYLQDWIDLIKKVYYVEERLIDFLYDKREQKAMIVHPLVKSAAVTETDFDHIRTRYLFALRSGYKTLSHLYRVQVAIDRPSLTDLVLSDNESYLKKFAAYCTYEEYNVFADLIKNHDLDEDDAEIFEKLAELNSLGQ